MDLLSVSLGYLTLLQRGQKLSLNERWIINQLTGLIGVCTGDRLAHLGEVFVVFMSSVLPFPNNLEVHLAVLEFAKVCLSKCNCSLSSSAFSNGDCSNIRKFQNSFALAVPICAWNASFYCGNQALQVSSYYLVISYAWYSLEACKSSRSVVNSFVSMWWSHVGWRLLKSKLRQNLSSNRMVEVGRDLWRSSGSNPLLEQVIQDYV